jgi:hypothetical protein
MNKSIPALRELPSLAGYKAGDVLVIFGELFARGYANGIVDEAVENGMTIVRSTVGRRDNENLLRALSEEELAAWPKPYINIPLEAGFDMEPASDGRSPVDLLSGVKMSEWDQVKLDWPKIEDSRARGIARFQKNLKQYMDELAAHIPKGANVLFVHTMAGGVPRAKILMPTMNKVFKGQGDRYVSSEKFWDSDLGRLSSWNFEEVTAQTFRYLLEYSAGIRERVQKDGGITRYVAYGYHGTEVMINGEYQWQTYTPYVQGWAKMSLEKLSNDARKSGLQTCVYNCPEILTNSSSIFLGLEVSLYPLLGALQKEGGKSPRVQALLKECQALLKSEHSFEEVLRFTDQYLTSPVLKPYLNYEKWPQHNGKEQMELMMQSSAELIAWHQDAKKLITFVLSEEIFKATGYLMFHDSFAPKSPVVWLGHDIMAKAIARA